MACFDALEIGYFIAFDFRTGETGGMNAGDLENLRLSSTISWVLGPGRSQPARHAGRSFEVRITFSSSPALCLIRHRRWNKVTPSQSLPIVAHLAEKAELKKTVATAVMTELVALAMKETKAGGQFLIPGLGKAVKAHREARTGRNPQTGEAIKIPAKTVVKFRLGKAFKDAVVPAKKK